MDGAASYQSYRWRLFPYGSGAAETVALILTSSSQSLFTAVGDPFPIVVVLKLGLSIALGLAELHGQKLIVEDLKPGVYLSSPASAHQASIALVRLQLPAHWSELKSGVAPFCCCVPCVQCNPSAAGSPYLFLFLIGNCANE